jgi:hypothetical protein
MYRFSRSIYREIAPYVIEDDHQSNGCSNRQRVLDACEGAIRRLALDRRYFARPARSLFTEVRSYFPINEQLRVYKVIETNIQLALEHLERLPADGIGLDGRPTECRAHTRKGTPCQRTPLPGRDYCPSHKHLEEPLDGLGEDVVVPDENGADENGVGSLVLAGTHA